MNLYFQRCCEANPIDTTNVLLKEWALTTGDLGPTPTSFDNLERHFWLCQLEERGGTGISCVEAR